MHTDAAARLERLEELVRALSREQEPGRAADRFATTLREIYGPTGIVFAAPRDDVEGGYVVTRLVDPAGRALVDSANLLEGAPDAPVHVGGLLGRWIGEGRAQRLVDVDVGGDALLGPVVPPGATLLVLPVYRDGRARNWVVLFRPEHGAFDPLAVETSLLRVNVFGGLLAAKQLNRDLEEALAWIREEIDQIAMVQRSLLPRRLPEIEGVEIAARLETFDRAGGDYYDFLPWRAASEDDERWTWIVADASGHGPAAAVIVAMLHVLLRALPAPLGGPAALLREINARLFECPTCSNFMTAFAGCYQPTSRQLVFALAGHPPPLLRRPDGRVVRAEVDPSVPMGVLDAIDPPFAAMRLEPGSALLVYTDGLVDDPGGAFGEAHLMEAFADAKGDAEAVLDHLFEAAARERGERHDDQTAVVVRA